MIFVPFVANLLSNHRTAGGERGVLQLDTFSQSKSQSKSCRPVEFKSVSPKHAFPIPVSKMKPALNRRLLVVLLALILMPGLFQVTGECQSGKPSSGDLYRYQRLKGRQLTLFDQWAAEHNERNGTSLHPATVYSSLATSQRSTFEGITHALLRSRITDSQHPMRRNALDLVSSVDQIAGRVSGVGGDKQYRLYVRLVPEAQEVLSQTRSFFRDKDNTVFHKDYPTNFRQRGREPTLQISMSKDSVRADINVDYRSSKVPNSDQWSPQGGQFRRACGQQLLRARQTMVRVDSLVADRPRSG